MNGNLEAINQALSGSGTIAIAVTQRPNIDQMGAALALYLILRDMGKSVSVVSSGQPLVEVSSLVGIDKVKTSFEAGGSGDLTVSFPYVEGEIEKISYTLENGFLNIIVKAGEQGLSFDKNQVIFKRSGEAPQALFTIGVQKLSDLSPVFNIDLLKDTAIVNVDNSTDNQGYGEIVLVNPQASSVSEIVANIILGLGMTLDQDASQNLLSGISHATRNFSDPKTSSLAFEMAGVAMRNGARREVIKQQQQKPQGQGAQRQFNQPQNQQNFQRSKQSSQQNFPQPQQSGQRQNQNQNQNPQNRGNINREYQKEDNDETTPPGDWLEPKIYKGSTDVG